jgi:soluble cytochrome b562
MSKLLATSLRRAVPLFLVGSIAVAVAATYPAGRPVAAADGPLEEAMERMNASMKVLLKGVSADNRDAALDHVAKMQASILTAKTEKPHSAEKVAEGERGAFLAEYRKTLVQALAATCKLETALLDGKYDAANAVVKDELAPLKKSGHDRFNPDEE